IVSIVSAQTFQVVAVVPVLIEGHTLTFDVPFAALNDDGQIDIAMVLGDFFAPTDWAPDVGHGTIVPFIDVPWLTESPTSGVLAPGASQSIAVTVDTASLQPGVYDAIVLIQSNSAQQPSLAVPVHLVVPSYDQTVNNGGAAYTDQAGDVWAADKAYSAGSWGYVNQAATVKTRTAISGTADDPLYQTARRGLVEYRFDGLSAGVYQVDL